MTYADHSGRLEAPVANSDLNLLTYLLTYLTLLKGVRYNYEYNLKTCGLTSEWTLRAGLTNATKLVKAHCGIKAKQFIVKLAASSRRIHGPGHNCSISLDKKVKECKLRYVIDWLSS